MFDDDDEFLLDIHRQTQMMWTLGYVLLIGLVIVFVYLAWLVLVG